MLKKIGLFVTGCVAFATGLFGQAQPAQLTNDPTAVNDLAIGLVNNATGLFDQVVPIIIAVVGLGILITFAKMVKKR